MIHLLDICSPGFAITKRVRFSTATYKILSIHAFQCGPLYGASGQIKLHVCYIFIFDTMKFAPIFHTREEIPHEHELRD